MLAQRCASLLPYLLPKSVSGEPLRIVTAGANQVQELGEGQAYLDALKIHFGIELDAPYEALRPLPLTDQETELGPEW